MKVFVVPMDVAKTSCFTQKVNLSGIAFTLSFRWNERDRHFFVDFSTNDGEVLSRRLIPNHPMLGRNNGVTSSGDFYLLSEGFNADPGDIAYEEYGTTWKLYWVPSESKGG